MEQKVRGFFSRSSKAERRDVGTTCVPIIIYASRGSRGKLVDAASGKWELREKGCETADAPVLNLMCGSIVVSPCQEATKKKRCWTDKYADLAALHLIHTYTYSNKHRLHIIFPSLNPSTNITINIIWWIYYRRIIVLHIMLHPEKTSYHWKAALQRQTFTGNLCFQSLSCVRSLTCMSKEKKKACNWWIWPKCACGVIHALLWMGKPFPFHV